MKISVLLIFSCLFIISFAWNRDLTQSAIESIKSKQQQNGLWESLYETFSAVQTLDMLGAKNINNDNLCNSLSVDLTKGLQKPSDIYYALATFKKLKCGKIPTKTTDNLREFLKKPDELSTEELRYLVANIPLVGNSLTTPSLGKLVEIITDRMEDKGIFRSFKDVEDPSVLNAGHALRALAQLYRLQVCNKEQTEILETAVESIPELVKLANKGQNTVYFSDNKKDIIETTSVVVDGVFTLLTSFKKSKAPVAFTSLIQSFSNFFSNLKATNGRPSDIYQIVRSLHLLSRNTLQRAININLLNSRISTSTTSDERFLRVDVSNPLGESINNIKVYLAKVRASKSSSIIVETQLMDPFQNTSDNTLYQFNILAAKPSPGLYIASIRVLPDPKDNFLQALTNDYSLSIVTSINVFGTSVTVSDSNSRESNSAKKRDLNYPETVSIGSVQPNQHLFINFRVRNEKTQKPFVVSQTFVQFTNEQSGAELILHAVPKGTLYGLHVDFSKNQEFWYLGGTFQASLIIGDSHIEKGIIWNSFNFQFPSDPSLITKSIWESKQEIVHLFREPEKRPPSIVSLFFTGLVLSPILIIFVGLGFTGFSFGKLPGLGSIYYLLFIGGIVMIALTIVLYWIALNMFTALYYISILLVFTVFVGQRALRSKALASLKKNA